MGLSLEERETSTDAVRKRTTHCRTGVKGAEHLDRFDGGDCELGCYVVGDARQAHDLDVQHLPGSARPFEIGASDMLQAEHERAARDRSLHLVRVQRQLIPDGGPDDVGTVGVEAFLDEEVDLAEIDDTEVDGELLGLADSRTALIGSRIFS